MSVPTQNNNYDCGLYLCQFAYRSVNLLGQSILAIDLHNKMTRLISDSESFSFDSKHIDQMRIELYNVITRVTEIYHESRVESTSTICVEEDEAEDISDLLDSKQCCAGGCGCKSLTSRYCQVSGEESTASYWQLSEIGSDYNSSDCDSDEDSEFCPDTSGKLL